MAGEATGFWSYVRKDDEGDHGRILALAGDLKDRYRIHTADELELFVDRESIGWGEAWQQRINEAIAGTTFFIPIITPSYFRSPACRHELLKFVREAERLGLKELLMPVYWVRVPELEGNPEESPDEAIRLVAKYDWQDLREASLEDRESSSYRKAVAGLAEELAARSALASRVGDVPVDLTALPHIDTFQTIPADDDGGIIDKLAATEDAMPRAAALLREITHQMEAINTPLEQAGADLQGAAKRGQGMKAALVITNRLAQDLEGPAEKISESGHEYGQALGELDPGIQVQLDLTAQRLESPDGNLTPADEESLRAIIGLLEAARHSGAGLEEMLAEAEPVAKFSRSLRAPIADIRSGLVGVLDGNAVIEEWAQRAAELLGEELPPDPDDDSSES